MDYQSALDYLDSLIKFGIKFGLERITALSEELGSPHKNLSVVHVGGTNGKGSTCSFISSILLQAGYRVGTYLSPYVYDPRERIQINAQMISKEDFAAIITRVKEAAEKVGGLTEFEIKTMTAFLYFKEQNVDLAVLEVGMGGRFDATNIVQPLTSIITNVTLDHMERLGNTIATIAGEKAGIIKPGTVVVTAAQHPDALAVISRKSDEQGAELWRVVPEEDKKSIRPEEHCVSYKVTNKKMNVVGSKWSVENLHIGLKGDFQYINAATAVAAVKLLETSGIVAQPEAIADGVSNAYIPGRMQTVGTNPLIVLDGAHNPDAAIHLARSLRQEYQFNNLILVIGMLENHDPDGVLRHLAPLASKIIATQSTWLKARGAGEIAECAKNYVADVETIYSVPLAVQRAQELANRDDLVLVTGSFYTIGEINYHRS